MNKECDYESLKNLIENVESSIKDLKKTKCKFLPSMYDLEISLSSLQRELEERFEKEIKGV